MDIAVLNETVEAAEGPDERLDLSLWDLVDARPTESINGDPDYCGKRCPVDTIAFDTAPKYTASLDAAYRLLEKLAPDAKLCHLSDDRHVTGFFYVGALAHQQRIVGAGKTLPLAICSLATRCA